METDTLKNINSVITDDYLETGEPEASEDRAPHKRAYWVELTRKALGDNRQGKPYSFGQINGLTSNWSVQKLRDRYFYCKKHANCSFPKAWFGMRKKDKS